MLFRSLTSERRVAEDFAARYGLEFVDMTRFRIENDLFRRVPFELMLRYGFIPEAQLDAVTALSGSGPAYFFFLVEAMIDAGILLGLPRAIAAELIVQTAVGSAIMLRDSGEHPVQLREAVTSPGGTTIEGLHALEKGKLRATVMSAVRAATEKSKKLGQA